MGVTFFMPSCYERAMTSTRWKRYKWVRTGVYQLRGWVRDDSMMFRVLNTFTNVAHDSQKTTFFLNDREVDGRTAISLNVAHIQYLSTSHSPLSLNPQRVPDGDGARDEGGREGSRSQLALLHIKNVQVHPARERYQGAPSRGHAGHNTRCDMLGVGEALRSDRVGEWV